MHALVHRRLVGIFLALAFGLGGIAGAFSHKMATVEDLAIVQMMAMGATSADICGKNGKALFAEVADKAIHAEAGTILPAYRPPLTRIALRAQSLGSPSAQIPATAPFDPGRANRAPPTLRA